MLPECYPIDCARNKGKTFRDQLCNPRNAKNIRQVPAFTYQALQKNTVVIPPTLCNPFEVRPLSITKFKQSYMRGEFPITIEYAKGGKRLKWQIPPEKLDYAFYLPLLFDGLGEDTFPYNFIVENGIKDLVMKAPHKVLPILPQIIIPLKNALNLRRPSLIMYALKCIQMLVLNCKNVGIALVPYYRQILPVVSLFRMWPAFSDVVGEIITKEKNLIFLIDETLHILERHGGPDAFINIKYMIPTYESCVKN